MWQSAEILNVFKNFNFNFEVDFLENTNLFKKLEYHFLFYCIKIENASFSYKTAMSDANVKTNGMVSTK